MNQQTAHLLKKACRNSDGTLNRERYRTLKANWVKVPWKARRPLLEAIYRSVGLELPITRAQRKAAQHKAA